MNFQALQTEVHNLLATGEPEQAEAVLRPHLAGGVGPLPLWRQMAQALRRQCRMQEVKQIQMMLVDTMPGDLSARFDLAETLLLLGEFDRGWREYRYRYSLAHTTRIERKVQRPRWEGEKMPGRTLLIHDRIKGKERDNPNDLKGAALDALKPLRFAEVYLAAGDDGAKAARVWLHQYKLLEGIDDPSFIEIWLYDGFGGARQLVQQIGRAIRRPDLTDPAGRQAIVRGGSQRLRTIDGAPTVAELTELRWDAYLQFERYAADWPDIAFTAETQLLPLLKRSSPMVQYVAGEFRGAHWLEQTPSMEAFVLPQRGVFTRLVDADANNPQPISDAFMDDLAAAAAEAMQ